MRVATVRDLGALVRTSRRAQGMTQAGLAQRLGVSREWVVRLEGGHPRVEAQKVLDALAVLELTLGVEQRPLSKSTGTADKRPVRQVTPSDGAATPAVKRAVSKKAATTRPVAITGVAARVVPKSSVSASASETAKASAPKAGRASRSTTGTSSTDPFESLFAKRKP